MRNNLIGTVDKIKLVSSYPNMLVRFTLHVGNQSVNCIVSDKKICNSLMFLEDGRTEVALYGNYNSRKQLVVKKLIVRNPTSFERVFAMGIV